MSSSILTWEEYEKIKLDKSQLSESQNIPEPPVTASAMPEELEEIQEYCLMYPDNPSFGYYNGSYIVNGKELMIENGVIRVQSKDDRDELKSKGFIYLYAKEIK